MKKFRKYLLYMVAAGVVISFFLIIYILIPVNTRSDEKKELIVLEKRLYHKESTPIVSLPLDYAPESMKKISKKCDDDLIYLKRMTIKEIQDLERNDREILSNDCKVEVKQVYPARYEETIKGACNFSENVVNVLRVISKASDENNKSEEESLLRIQKLCEIGGLIYRPEIDVFLQNNLNSIDDLSRFMFLKMSEQISEQNLTGRLSKNVFTKFSLFEGLIKSANRFIYLGWAMQELHENKKNINELSFAKSPITKKLLDLAWGWSNKTQEQKIINEPAN